jgi:hypothetical protein
MLEITIKIPDIEELKHTDINSIQSNMLSEEEALKLAEQGFSIYFGEDSISFSPDSKTAIYNLYVVVGNEEELKKSLKYYYPYSNSEGK